VSVRTVPETLACGTGSEGGKLALIFGGTVQKAGSLEEKKNGRRRNSASM
jgi:hypothetical protein